MGNLTQTTAEVQSNIDWEIDKAAGVGIKVDTDAPDWPWHDLIGLIQPNFDSPGTRPSVAAFQAGVNAYQYDTSDVLDCVYHVPHDWAIANESDIHLHIGFNTAIPAGQTFDIVPTVTYGSRDGVFGSPVTLATITYTSPAGGETQYAHPVLEVPLCRVVPTGIQLPCNDVEVDGLFIVSFVVGSTAGMDSDPFIFTADIHYRSTGIGTKNSADPFYG